VFRLGRRLFRCRCCNRHARIDEVVTGYCPAGNSQGYHDFFVDSAGYLKNHKFSPHSLHSVTLTLITRPGIVGSELKINMLKSTSLERKELEIYISRGNLLHDSSS